MRKYLDFLINQNSPKSIKLKTMTCWHILIKLNNTRQNNHLNCLFNHFLVSKLMKKNIITKTVTFPKILKQGTMIQTYMNTKLVKFASGNDSLIDDKGMGKFQHYRSSSNHSMLILIYMLRQKLIKPISTPNHEMLQQLTITRRQLELQLIKILFVSPNIWSKGDQICAYFNRG